MFIVILAAVLPAIGLLYFIWKKDHYRQEPTRELLKAYGYGMLSIPASLLLSGPLMALGAYTMQPETVGGAIRTALFGAGIPEELAKLLMLWLFLRKSRYYDEYIDGVVYAACVGLGFATLENIGYLFDNLSQWFSVGVARGLLSVPAHFFFAVTMGYFYSLASFGDPRRRSRNLILAAGVPILLHATFDAILMASSLATGIASSLILLFLGIYLYLVISSKKRIRDLLARDENFLQEDSQEEPKA